MTRAANNTNGRSVRIFLVDGNPTGLVTAEVINWSGHVISGSRVEIVDFLKREELDRTGIYFLFGHDPEETDSPMIYIGESDNVRKRLKTHNKEKDFWERVCVVTSKDSNITKAHAKYLEARLIKIASEIGKAKLENLTKHEPSPLPEADVSDMEYFIEQIQLILPVLGYDSFKVTPNRTSLQKKNRSEKIDEDISPIFEINNDKKKLYATGQEIEGEFVVFEGSFASSKWTTSGKKNVGYKRRHCKLIENGTLIIDDENNTIAKFTKDTSFSSPSAASSLIFGRSDNGRTSWIIKGTKKNYASWQESKVAEIVDED